MMLNVSIANGGVALKQPVRVEGAPLGDFNGLRLFVHNAVVTLNGEAVILDDAFSVSEACSGAPIDVPPGPIDDVIRAALAHLRRFSKDAALRDRNRVRDVILASGKTYPVNDPGVLKWTKDQP